MSREAMQMALRVVKATCMPDHPVIAALQAALAEQPAPVTDVEIGRIFWEEQRGAEGVSYFGAVRGVRAVLAAAIPPGHVVVPTATEKCPSCADGVLARHLCLRCDKCNIELYGDPEGKFNLAARPGAPR